MPRKIPWHHSYFRQAFQMQLAVYMAKYSLHILHWVSHSNIDANKFNMTKKHTKNWPFEFVVICGDVFTSLYFCITAIHAMPMFTSLYFCITAMLLPTMPTGLCGTEILTSVLSYQGKVGREKLVCWCRVSPLGSRLNEPRHEKICPWGLWPGLTQSGLFCYRRWPEAGNFRFR